MTEDKTKVIYQPYPNEPAATDYYTYLINGGSCDGESRRADVTLSGNNTDSSNSSNGDAYSMSHMLLMILMTLSLGLFYGRREEKKN